MSGGLILVLIIVVWLFVLAPLLLRGQKPISKAGEAFEETRVLHHGGADLPEEVTRRRPRLTRRDVRTFAAAEDDDLEVVAGEEIEDHAQVARGDTRAKDATRSAEGADQREEAPFVDGDIVRELPAPTVTANTPATAATADEPSPQPSAWEETDETDEPAENGSYLVDDTYLTPDDMLYPSAAGNSPQPTAAAEPAAQAEATESTESTELTELTEEEKAFAASRRGRGGFDPEADAAHSSTRYQRRQRTLLGLGLAVLVTIVLGVMFGGWWWAATAVAILITAGYLVALRSQVRQEQALRARRIRQLRRARLGVRHRDDEALDIPRQLRRPGAVVVELDDENPDFFDLPLADHAPATTAERAATASGPGRGEGEQDQRLRRRRRDMDIYDGTRAAG